jgi:ceramide glucosyltransferase
LADDNVLGRRIAEQGLRVVLADTVPLTTVPETTLRALFRHELRWARTIRALEPAGFAASVLQYPLFWALLSLLVSGFASWALQLYAACWLLRAVAGLAIDHPLRRQWQGNRKATLAFSCPVWLLPLRDLLSVGVMLMSYGSRQVEWRGQALQADSGERLLAASSPTEDIERR